MKHVFDPTRIQRIRHSIISLTNVIQYAKLFDLTKSDGIKIADLGKHSAWKWFTWYWI